MWQGTQPTLTDPLVPVLLELRLRRYVITHRTHPCPLIRNILLSQLLGEEHTRILPVLQDEPSSQVHTSHRFPCPTDVGVGRCLGSCE